MSDLFEVAHLEIGLWFKASFQGLEKSGIARTALGIQSDGHMPQRLQ